MKIGLWIVQVLLAVAFIGSGFMKAAMPIEALAENMAFVLDTPAFVVRFAGEGRRNPRLGLHGQEPVSVGCDAATRIIASR